MMKSKFSLVWKLTLAFILVAVTSTVVVALFIRLTSNDRLIELILDQQRSDLKVSLTDYYELKGSWTGIAQNWQALQSSARRATPPPDPPNYSNQQPPSHDRNKLFGLADSQGMVVVSMETSQPIGSMASQQLLTEGTPIEVNGKQVGTLLMVHFQPRFTPEESLYLQRINMALIYAALVALLVAVIIGVLLARTLVKPVQALTGAVQNITQGHLEQEVKVTSQDEIGQLAHSFNQMSREVARVNKLRRQMTADIAHDLRTPLTVIAGYIEAMQDGVLQPTPERMALMYDEIRRLQDLVGDLRILSLADSGELSIHPQLLSPTYLLERAIAPYEHRLQELKINLQMQGNPDLPMIWLDESRMMQVFGNLIANSLRYTPEDGNILLSASQVGDHVEMAIKDSGKGIAPQDLPHIFERFFRADPSRYTENGESSGLGLAIAKALVETMGGTISAESTPGEGTTMRVSFPVLNRPKTIE
jgi:signal transduction histidine kinase